MFQKFDKNFILLNKIKRLLALFLISTKKYVRILKKNNVYEIRKDSKIIKISQKHQIYVFDIMNNFDYYFSSVSPVSENGKLIVDFSKSLLHNVNGYDLHKIIFPSIPEPIETTFQYLEFANLNETSNVLDLGAYSGLTSLIFDRKISCCNKNAKGRVIAVEPDVVNLSCLIQNIEQYKRVTERNIEYIFAAVSDKDGVESFLCDGSMGANSNFNKLFRKSSKIEVPTIKLSSIVQRFNLDNIDFIKCDVEGAEKYLFNDDEFFAKYSPRIIVESHFVGNSLTTDFVVKTLSGYGYNARIVKQEGSDLPLIECTKD